MLLRFLSDLVALCSVLDCLGLMFNETRVILYGDIAAELLEPISVLFDR